ncbi:MAG TPA: hypothetical protein VG225_09265 [Terracidiphilus sp.]|nr:hypothetical protein [Terracidiphilus sp.]
MTATIDQTLSAYTFALQAPSAVQDWAIPGTSLSVSFPVQQSNLPSGTLMVGCTLDSTTLCPYYYIGLGPSNSTLMQQVAVPPGTPLGQHQLTMLTTFFNNTQQFSFPFYVADFSGSLGSTAVTLSAGGSTSITATLTATTGFLGNVALSCGNSAVTCNFSQGTVTLTGGATQQVTVTLAAPATVKGAAPSHPASRTGRLSDPPAFAVVMPLGLAIALRRRRAFCAIFVAVLLLFVISCGSGSSSGSGTPPPPSQYSVTVQANGYGITHTLGTITVTVDQE